MCQQCEEYKAFTFSDAQPKPPIISDDLTAAVLLLLWEDNQRNMMEIIRREWDSKLTFKESVTKQLMDLIAKDAAQAAQLGRQRAGIAQGFDSPDLAFGRAWVLQGKKWIGNWVDDILNGKYGPFEQGYDSPEVQKEVKKQNLRARMHANKIISAANEAFVLATPEEEKITWNLSEFEKHCADCPRIAAGSPYTRETLKQYPKDGSTQCVTNCLCWLTTSKGRKSFVPLPVSVAEPHQIPQLAGV